MAHKSTRGARVLAVLSALAVSLLGFSALPAANAAPGNIDPGQIGTLTIHKHAGTPGNGAGHDGSELEQVPAKPLAGVTFRVQKVKDFDLNAQENWAHIKDLSAANVQGDKVTINGQQYSLKDQTAETNPTSAEGITKVEQLPVGLYYVTELSTGTNKVTQKATPFFVTIPLPSKAGADTSWNYNPHVYPKNQTTTDTGEKKVGEDTNVRKVGDKLPYEVALVAPGPAEKNPIALGFYDFSGTNVEFDTASVTAKVEGGETLTSGEDFIIADAVKKPAGRNGHKISLTDRGLAKVKGGQKVVFKYTVTVKTVGEGGKVENSFTPILNDYDPWGDYEKDPNNPPTPPTPNEPENKAFYGDYKFTKVGESKNGNPLENAEFAVYATESDAKAGTNPILTVTSDAQGVVHFKGLYLGKYTKDEEANAKRTFYLKETKAPAGYVLDNTIKPIEVTPGNAENPKVGENIVNKKAGGPNLPLTGSAGTVILTLGGVAALGLAGGVALRNARRERENA